METYHRCEESKSHDSQNDTSYKKVIDVIDIMYNLYMLSFINRTGIRLSSGNHIAASAYRTVHTEADAVCIRIVWAAHHMIYTSDPV